MNPVRNIIDRILSREKRIEANNALDSLPEGWFKQPASASGRYHPMDERGEYGLLMHTYRFAALVPQMVRIVNDPRIEGGLQDDLLVASIFHDAFKLSLSKEQYWMHPEVAAVCLHERGLFGAAIACALHEGPWTDRRIEQKWGTWLAPINSSCHTHGLIAHIIDYSISRFETWQVMQPEFRNFLCRVAGIPA